MENETRELAIAIVILGLQFVVVVLSLLYWKLGIAYDRAQETIKKLNIDILILNDSKVSVPIAELLPMPTIPPTALYVDHDIECVCQKCSMEDWSLSVD